jgi:ribosomal protein S18 acetylase RimI-like enzyme
VAQARGTTLPAAASYAARTVTTSIAVRRATAAEAGALSRTLADAFSDDPVVTWLLPKGIRSRERRVHRLWSVVARDYLRHDKPCYLTADGRGAALWAPPGTWAPPVADQLRELLPMAGVFRLHSLRASRLQTQMLKAHPRRPPHWYLYAIGTQAEAQGQGLGSALLREVLDRLDESGDAAYLESSNIRNVPLYERHGFSVVEEMVIAGDGPTMWRMWRDPAG